MLIISPCYVVLENRDLSLPSHLTTYNEPHMYTNIYNYDHKQTRIECLVFPVSFLTALSFFLLNSHLTHLPPFFFFFFFHPISEHQAYWILFFNYLPPLTKLNIWRTASAISFADPSLHSSSICTTNLFLSQHTLLINISKNNFFKD